MLNVVENYELIRKISNKVYWGSKFALLRSRIEPEDLEQMVFLKLYNNDLYKVYSEDFSLKNFIYRVATHCAINYSSLKSTQTERVILDAPLSSSEDCGSKSMMDCITNSSDYLTYSNNDSYSDNEFSSSDLNVNDTIEFVTSKINDKVNERHLIIYNGEEMEYSLRNLFKLFIETRSSKAELKDCVINSHTRKPIAQVTFDAIWKELLSSVEEIMKSI